MAFSIHQDELSTGIPVFPSTWIHPLTLLPTLSFWILPEPCFMHWTCISEIIYRWQISTWKYVQHYWVIGKMQVKVTMRYLHVPVRMGDSNYWQHQMLGEDAERLDHSYIPSGNVKLHSQYENQFGTFFKS